jgi:hypothetical protein
MHPRNPRAFSIERNSSQQLLREGIVPRSIQSDFVFFIDLVTRMGQLLGKITVIS